VLEANSQHGIFNIFSPPAALIGLSPWESEGFFQAGPIVDIFRGSQKDI